MHVVADAIILVCIYLPSGSYLLQRLETIKGRNTCAAMEDFTKEHFYRVSFTAEIIQERKVAKTVKVGST